MVTNMSVSPFGAVMSILLGLFVVGVVITVLVLGIGLIFRLIGRVTVCVGGIIGDVVSIVVNLVAMPFQLARALVLLVIGRFARADAAAMRFHTSAMEIGRRAWSAAIQRPLRIVGVDVPPRRAPRTVPAAVASNPSGPPPSPPPHPRGFVPVAAPFAPPPPRERSVAPPWPDPSMLLSGFPGYTIESRLPTGGSGAKLYVAVPDATKRPSLKGAPERVVIKSFAIGEGSTLPQIVRESRSLESARTLGLVLDHAFEAHRFWYAMPHYEGPTLGQFASIRHRGVAASAPLPEPSQRELVALVADVVESLARFHAAGLWHKDIKPDNIIVSGGGARLIDVGLVTPLASTFTLTTHGTEYFRDPEMVRQALRGAKVNQVDGARFDLYSAGAVLYSVIENTFPAHGGLSSFAKPSPDALRWIVRRSMAEYSKRYHTAEAMLEDLRYILAAKDLASVRPASLPSVRGGALSEDETPEKVTGTFSEKVPVTFSGPSGGEARAATLGELARQTAQEAVVVARAAAKEAVAAARAAAARHPGWTSRSKAKKTKGALAVKAPRNQWSPWATAAIVVASIMFFGVRFERSSDGGVRLSGPGFKIGSTEGSSTRRNGTTTTRKASTDPTTAELPKGDGKLLVDRAALLKGLLPEAQELKALEGIGSKGWSPVTGDIDALAAVEALNGSAPELIHAELVRRGYAGLVRLEPNGQRVVVKPVSLPAR